MSAMFNSEHSSTLIAESIMGKSIEQLKLERLQEVTKRNESRMVDGIAKTKAFVLTLNESQRKRFLDALKQI